MTTSAPVFPSHALQIPVDFFVSKKHPLLSHGQLGFTDSAGNLIFRATRIPSKTRSSSKWLLLDASGSSLFSVFPQDDGSWHGYKGDGEGEKEMIFRVQRILKKCFQTELEIFLAKESSGESTSDLKVKGCPFQKSCVIYGGNAIVAQTSLMYKLHQIWVGRSRFRLTIFPGSIDHALVVALVVVFLHG